MADKQARIVKRVLIASPGDLFEERKIAEEVIADWNIRHHRSRLRLEAVLWEKAAAPESRGKGDGAQYSINHQLVDSCDCAIGMFWTRIGTPTKVAPGGAVEEVQRVQSHDKPVMLYFSNVAFRRQDVDFEQLTQLDAFRAS